MKIPWLLPQVGKKEKILVNKVLESRYLNDGKFTRIFEERVCKLLNCKYALAVTNGTSAMYLSLKALGIGQGDEVIVPDLTFIATANAVKMCGADVVLVDVGSQKLTMDPEAFKKAITKKTKAVIPVHVSGRAANMEAILKIAHGNNIYVVEDAAEAFISKHKRKYLGTFGKTGCFSFSSAKIVTSGQGGLIVTDDKNLYIKLKMLKDQGRAIQGSGGDDIHTTVGYNFKWTDIQAAVILGQLENIEQRIEKRIKQYILYKKYLKDIDNISIFEFDVSHGEVPLWTDGIFVSRDKLYIFLNGKNIDCRRFWFPIHTQNPYKLPDNKFPNSTDLSPKVLWLPSGMDMKDKEVEIVSNQVKSFYSK